MEEDGSDLAAEIWEQASRRVAAEIAYAEARAALAAARRASRLTPEQLRAVVEELDAACAAMHLIAVDGPLARRAGDLAEQHRLRGYDAVHLAAASSVGSDELLLVTWDRELAGAASAAGLLVAPA